MKILFLTGEFPPVSIGGAASVTYDLAHGLQDKGHDVFVITVALDKSNQGKINPNGLRVFRIYASYHQRWQAWLGLYNPRAVLRVKKIIKEIKPDIVHAHNIHHKLSYYCLKIAKKYAKGVFLTAHDVMLVKYGKFFPQDGKDVCKIKAWDEIKYAKKRYNPFRRMVIRHYLKYADKIFAVSNPLKKLLKINNIKNVETIYNGIDVNSWKEDVEKVKKFKAKYNLNSKKVIFFGGRISGAKGGNELLRALAQIKMQDIVLLVVGEENQYVKEMKGLVKKLNLEQNVVFTGWLEGGELKSAYHSADVCVCPSICFEAFGMVNLEAMACKKPVVSSYFGGPREVVINNETGYLLNPYNIELMAEKILDLFKNLQKAKQFGEAGYERAKECFSLDRQVNQTLKWYKKYV